MRIPFVSITILTLAACAPSGSDPKSIIELKAECEAMIAAETGTRPSSVTAVSAVPDVNGSTITVSVPGSDVPWICRADTAGVIEGIGIQT